MMHYTLRCVDGHDFDGWFPNSAAFDQQNADQLVECPTCGSTHVSRGIMAPAVGRSEPRAMPAGMKAALQKLRADVEKHCDYVGADFAAQARMMHEGQTAVRLIYGEATAEEAEQLYDDGIQVSLLPWVGRADA